MDSGNSVWQRVNRILMVVSYHDQYDVKAYSEALKEVGVNIHDCDILALVKSKKEVQALDNGQSVTYFSEQEINLLGKNKNVEAAKLLSDRFDLKLVMTDLSTKESKLIGKVKSNISLGINVIVENLTINLSSEDKRPHHLLNFAKETLEKIY